MNEEDKPTMVLPTDYDRDGTMTEGALLAIAQELHIIRIAQEGLLEYQTSGAATMATGQIMDNMRKQLPELIDALLEERIEDAVKAEIRRKLA